MVRRWSYININSSNFNLLRTNSHNCLSAYYNFKVFKKTTFFRKFNITLSLYLRKKNIRRKRHTNLINITHIVYTWIKSYTYLRKFARYTQLHGVLQFSRAISSWSLFQKNISNFGYGNGVLVSSLPTKNKKIIFSPSSSLLTEKHTNYPSVNSFFVTNQYFYTSNNTLNSLIASDLLMSPWLKLIIKFVLTVRSITILCSLLQLTNEIRKYVF